MSGRGPRDSGSSELPDLEPGDINQAAIERRLPKPKPQRFIAILFDRKTGKHRRVNFSNVVGGLEGLMLVPARNRGLSDGIITAAFQEKAEEMDPTFVPRPRKPLESVAEIESPEPLDRRHDAQGRFLPRWRRRRDDQ